MARFFGDSKLNRRELLLLAGVGAALAGCGSAGALAKAKVYRMGERVVTGKLIYTVLETEWLSAIGSRTPDKKFLAIRLTINNSGNTERAVPLLELVSPKGNSILESSDGTGLEEWLGLLRSLAATETAQGKLLFDVPQDNYKLRVTDGGEPGSEVTALVDIPLQIREEQHALPPGAEKGAIEVIK